MPELYIERTIPVKPNCTPSVLYRNNQPVHDVYMAVRKEKKVVPRPKRAQYARTFIKQWREHRDLTQEQLAERVATYLIENGLAKGYTHASVGRLENGKMGYTQPVLEAIADALQTDPASLLMRDPEDPAAIWTIWDLARPAERQTIAEHAEIVVKRRAG